MSNDGNSNISNVRETFRSVNITRTEKPRVSDDLIVRWNNLADTCAQTMQVPVSLIMTVQESKIEIFSKNNSTGNPYETGDPEPLGEGLYSETVVEKDDFLLISDTSQTEKWNCNSGSNLEMQAYLGTALLWPDGEIFGTICVLDYKENRFSASMIELLLTFRQSIESDLELLITRAEMQKLEYTDQLTTLFNRKRIDELLLSEFQRAERYDSTYSVILFDVDDFKTINDTYGSHTGDQILITIADIINERIRAVDIAGRWEGEEFIIICPETKLGNTAFLAESLRKTIESTSFPISENVTCSFGVATYRNTDQQYDDALNWADQLLYEVKVTGKNKVLSG